MGSGHHKHDHPGEGSAEGNIRYAFWLNSLFVLVEIAGGLYTNSVAILSDALHDLGDSLSLGLAFYFQKKSRGGPDRHFSYGYKRFSLVGALVNALVLLTGCGFILSEAISRITHPEPSDAKGMLLLAFAGVLVNTLAMLRLRKGKTINEKMVGLHFLEDVLGWGAVFIGAIVMLFVNVPVLDPLLSIGIALYILFNAFRNLKGVFRILLQGVPVDLSEDEVRSHLGAIEGVENLHDIHIWSMDGNYNIITLHVLVNSSIQPESYGVLKAVIRNKLKALNIEHSTIEVETSATACKMREC
jgi:cobalt-zinc-cadmium efflux system protein